VPAVIQLLLKKVRTTLFVCPNCDLNFDWRWQKLSKIFKNKMFFIHYWYLRCLNNSIRIGHLGVNVRIQWKLFSFNLIFFFTIVDRMFKNLNFCQKIIILVKIHYFVQNHDFCQKNNYFGENSLFCSKSWFWSKIIVLLKNHNFDQKSLFYEKSIKF